MVDETTSPDSMGVAKHRMLLLSTMTQALWQEHERLCAGALNLSESCDVLTVVETAAEVAWSAADSLLALDNGQVAGGWDNLGPFLMKLRVVAWALWATHDLQGRSAGVNRTYSSFHALDSVLEVLPGLLDEWETLARTDIEQAV